MPGRCLIAEEKTVWIKFNNQMYRFYFRNSFSFGFGLFDFFNIFVNFYNENCFICYFLIKKILFLFISLGKWKHPMHCTSDKTICHANSHCNPHESATPEPTITTTPSTSIQRQPSTEIGMECYGLHKFLLN